MQEPLFHITPFRWFSSQAAWNGIEIIGSSPLSSLKEREKKTRKRIVPVTGLGRERREREKKKEERYKELFPPTTWN